MTMKIKTITFFLAFSIFSLSAVYNYGSDKITLNNSQKHNLEVIKANYHVLHAFNSLSSLSFGNTETEQGTFSFLLIKGYTKNLEYGDPLLPVKRELIEIPSGAVPVVNILSYETEVIDLEKHNLTGKLYPSQPEQFKDQEFSLTYNPAAYEINSYGDKEIISVDDLGYLRGTRIGRLNIAPVKYNPVANKILVYNNIEFEIIFEGADIQKTNDLKTKYYSPYFTQINKQLLNYSFPAARENFMRYPVKYVIVSDPMFESQLQEFVEWKTEKGFTVVEAYTDDPQVGDTPDEIKSYLQNLYQVGTPEDPAPSFILFVGDVSEVPAWSGNTGGHVTDMFYCEYTNDYFPDVYFGRFSAQTTAQLQPQIDKTLMYEKYEIPDPSYLDTVVMVAGMDGSHGYDWGNGQINYGTINYFNEDHGLYSDTYLYPNSGSQAAEIRQRVSDGVSYGNYTAHCSSAGWADPSFTTSHVPALENEDQYGLLVGNCCSSNEFDANECFGEALLRATDKGALAYIGGSNSTMWDPDYYWGVGVGQISENPPPYSMTTLGAYDRLFHDHGEAFGEWYVTAYEMIYAGNLAVTEGTPGSAEYYWEIYCVMGDPSVAVYLGVPDELTASYPALIPIGSTSVTVSTEPYAYVGITMDGILYGAALADSLGEAIVPLENLSEPGTANITITKQNYQPHFGTSQVSSPSGPYIILNNYAVNDSLGNNNGLIDYGEEITLDMTLENVGQDDAENITAKLISDDVYISITDSIAEWGLIASGDSVTIANAFAFDVSDSIPDQHLVEFEIIIENNTREQWNENINLTLNAPVLASGILVIDDEEGGNGNGRLDPGETADVIIPTLNNGHSDIFNVETLLESSSTGVTVNSSSFSFDTIQPGITENSVFNISIDESIQIGTVITLDFSASSEFYSLVVDYLVTVGLVMEDWESGTFSAFDWTFEGEADWLMCDQNPYEGLYCSESGDIDDQETSGLILEFTAATDDSISFYKKVSCEDDPWNDNYDYLAFFIDGTEMGRWDGEVAWSREEYPVSQGQHTFKWIYSKDYSESNGSDCAWVDYIVFPPEPNYVGIEENDTKDLLHTNIFPNPASTKVNILVNNQKAFNHISIKLFNNTGQLVREISEEKSFSKGIQYYEMDINGLNEGIYYIVVENEINRQTEKLIITKN